MSKLVLFAVLNRDGKLRRGGRALYSTKAIAQNQARCDGDSVVQVEIDLDREPLFIRQKKLPTEE